MARNTEKLSRRLQALEDELARELTAALPAVTRNDFLLFFSARHNPHDFPAHWLSPRTEEMIEKADEVQALRHTLSLPTDAGVAHLFIEACMESAHLDNKHRLGPRRLAQRLLDQLALLAIKDGV